MWFVVNFLCSRAGRAARAAVGTWLLLEGMTRATRGGLMMTMAGVVLAVTGLASLCLVEEAMTSWGARDTTRPPAPRDYS